MNIAIDEIIDQWNNTTSKIVKEVYKEFTEDIILNKYLEKLLNSIISEFVFAKENGYFKNKYKNNVNCDLCELIKPIINVVGDKKYINKHMKYSTDKEKELIKTFIKEISLFYKMVCYSEKSKKQKTKSRKQRLPNDTSLTLEDVYGKLFKKYKNTKKNNNN